jgi:hypothetical protein
MEGHIMSITAHPFEKPGSGQPKQGEAKVREIYPGASVAPQILNRVPGRTDRPDSRPWFRRYGLRPQTPWGSEAGMATAEYAIATLAAVGFAGLLVFILRSEEVRGFLLNLIRTALALP